VRVLVTGAAGFIGRRMVAALRGHDVTALDVVDDFDALPFFRADTFRYDLVIHAAAIEPHRKAIDKTPLTVGGKNLILDAEMFGWAARTKPGRVVYLSSSAAYPVELQGASCFRPCGLHENDINLKWTDTPDAIYGELKLMGERLAAAYRQQGGTVTVCRPFSGYGEDQDDRFPFGAFRDRARRRDDPFEIWGDGTQVRDWIHVDDMVGAILAAHEHGVDGPVNLCTGIGTSLNDLAAMFAADVGYKPTFKHLLDAPKGVAYRVGDPTLMRTFYEPKVSIEEGVKRALAPSVRPYARPRLPLHSTPRLWTDDIRFHLDAHVAQQV